MCFKKGTLEHIMIECCYFEHFYNKVSIIFNELGFANLNFNLVTLICGYKAGYEGYNDINIILSIIYFTVYKTWVIVNAERKYNNPLRQLLWEMRSRKDTKTYDFILWKKIINLLAHTI